MKNIVFVFTCLFLTVLCRARIITVDDDGPADFNTIQAAIDDSNDGDTIIVADGVYTGEGNRDIEFGESYGWPPGPTRAITVRSANGPENCIIDCNGTVKDPHRGFRFICGEEANSVISGFTITNGFARCESIYPPPLPACGEHGGAIHCGWYSSPTINNCLIRGNRGMYGGGISCHYESNPTVSNCIFIGNLAYNGGGIWNNVGEMTVTNCILWGNRDNGGTGESAQIDGTTVFVNYCCIQGLTGALGGIGNIGDDPCFFEPGHWEDPCNTPTIPWDDIWIDGDYHLKSQAGRWDPNSESWVLDDVTSPCIDAGNPGCPVGDEPSPNGNRRNMGAYGGTAEASKSPPNWRSIADMTNDWIVDSNDLIVYLDYWLESGECIPSDFDRSQFVDFDDFAIFGLKWSYPSALESGIFYQVEDCNMAEGQNQPSATDSNDTRFSVRVEGRYIHFKDLITANCCLDEIELQMTVEDGLITIHEIEHLTTPCFCLCDYPTTATLGPFEPGVYLLEVIDIDGKSLGIVEVTIGGSSEPGLTFRIDQCDMFSHAEQSDQTRFSVTVDDMYIHFEDKMTANCCPDELELEMTIEDGLITIYENEYTSNPCRCVCFFPVTATLGPFEPGTYTLEVYEYHGGFIGSTTVVIDPPP